MKPIKLELLLQDKTRQGWESAKQGAEDTGKSVEDLTDKFKSELTKQQALVVKLKEELGRLQKELEQAPRGAKRTALQEEVKAATEALNQEEAALKRLTDETSRTSSKTESLRAQIAKQKQAMATMTEGTREYAKAMAELGELQDRYGDITRQGSVMADDERHIKATTEALSGLTGAMTAGVGVASLLGAEQDKLAAIQTKLQAVMAISMGIQQTLNVLNKDSYTRLVLVAKAKNLLTAANARLAAALGISTVAAQALMATLTLGLSAVITGLIAAWHKFSQAQETAAQKLKERLEIEKEAHSQASRARVELEQSIRSVKEFTGTKAQEAAKVEELNRKYGATFGIYRSLADWYEVLTSKGEAYTQMLFNQAKAQTLIQRAVDLDQQIKEVESTPDKDVEGAVGLWTGLLLTQSQEDARNKRNKNKVLERLKKQKKEALDEANNLNKLSEQQAKDFNINLNPQKTTGGTSPQDIQAQAKAIETAKRQAQAKITALTLELMQEGAQKERAQAADELYKELARIKEEEQARMEAIRQARKAGVRVEASAEQTVMGQSKEQEELAYERFDKAVSDITARTLAQEAELWEQAKEVHRTALQSREAEIDRHYEELVKKAKDNQELIQALERARRAEKKTARAENKLQGLDHAQEVELKRQEIALQGLGLDELLEVKRNQVLIKYAKQRIAILKKMGGERNKQEAELLEQEVTALEKKTKNRSIQGILNEKIRDGLTGLFKGAGRSAEEAQAKADKLFAGLTKGGALAAEGIGMLQAAFGGLDEDLDKVLSAASNIASGFATGGLAGGIMAGVGEVMSFIGQGIQASERHKEALKKVMQEHKDYLHAYRLALMEEQLTYKLGTNIFGTDKVGKAVNAVDAYRRAVLGLKEELKGETPTLRPGEFYAIDAKRTGSLAVQGDLLRRYLRDLEAYRQGLGALSKIEVKTGHRKTGFLGLGKGEGVYSSVLDLPEYKELVKDGKLDVKMAKALMSTRELTDESKRLLQTLIDLQEAQDKAYEELNNSLQETFGSLGDAMTDSIVNAFDRGLDAADEFRKGVTGVLANLAKQMIYSIFLKDKFDGLQEEIRKIYSSQDISATDIAKRSTDLIGGFFKGLSPQFEAAKEFQREFWANAERNGFDRPGALSSQQATAGVMTTLSQEQGTKLEGLFTSVQDHVSGMHAKMEVLDRNIASAMDVLLTIARNTSYCRLLEQMADTMERIERVGIKTRD